MAITKVLVQSMVVLFDGEEAGHKQNLKNPKQHLCSESTTANLDTATHMTN